MFLISAITLENIFYCLVVNVLGNLYLSKDLIKMYKRCLEYDIRKACKFTFIPMSDSVQTNFQEF